MAFNLSNLNEVQRLAVQVTDGPVMILAGAGSGKTRTLVTRISYLLNELNLSPHQLLALTFSNKAAREMRERIALDVDFDIGALQVTTFHAFCAKLLRSEANYLGLSRNFTIYDDSESKAIVKTLLDRKGISTKEINPYEILNYIDSLKNLGFYQGRDIPNAPTSQDEFFEYFGEYESELSRANAIDFGGLITAVIQLFEKFPDVLKRYQDRFKYVLVDEYQDTNRAQFDLIKMLCEKRRNVCVVGDEDQSIYSWRGADIRNILDFEKVFPEVKVLKLEQNYRSSKNIIEAASCVIEKNVLRKGKQMWTENPEGDSVEIIECFNDKDEADFIAKEINTLVKNQNVDPKEVAVFYRSNAQARLIEDSLRKFKINYKVVGGVRFYERKEIKDILSYMRLVINSKDSLALSRIINIPARGIGTTSLRKLEVEAINSNSSLWEILVKIVDNQEEYGHVKLSSKVKASLIEFVNLINELKVLDENKQKPSLIYEKCLHESGYYAFLKANKDYETIARLENLDELYNAISQHELENPASNLAGFLETITLDTSGSHEEDKIPDQISLMTVHGAKGLEFSHAFVAGAEENVFPSYRSIESGEMGLEEERRLFYVAMTRAMKKLYICFAQGRMLFGQVKFNGPSRFIDEIPEKLFSWRRLGGDNRQNFNSQNFSDDNFSQESNYQDEEVVYQIKESFYKPKFPKGSHVQHTLYGKGTVLESEGSGADEKVLIKFNDGNRKKFMVKFAPISLI